MSSGTVTAGAVVSRTVTRNDDDEVLPCESVARQTLSVVPIGKTEPDGCAQLTATTPSTRSKAVGGVNVTTAPSGDVASTVMPSGLSLIAGGVVSWTTTTTPSVPAAP